MNPQAAESYLRTRVLTATPEQLQMMLYDGAMRFGEQGRRALQEKKYEDAFNAISRVQRIVTELNSTLRHDVYPELCGKLASLYNFAYRRLICANTAHDIQALDEAMNVLRYQRETWTMLMQRSAQDRAAAAAQSIDMPAPSEQMEASICMQG